MVLPIAVAPDAPTPDAPIFATSIVPLPVTPPAFIVIASRETLPPIAPCIAIAPPAVLIIKSRLELEASELTVAELLKVTVVFAASASIVMSPSRVTGPVMSIAPSATAEVVILPPR